MTKRMLIDGSHPEEVRVVITDGNRLDEYDIETSTKSQLKGNIYLAKVTRVEPSLQAAFVDYGSGRHGFLAFSEIHPDYYQIPIEDREALKRDLAQLEGKARAAQAHVDEIDGDVSGASDDEAEINGDEGLEATDQDVGTDVVEPKHSGAAEADDVTDETVETSADDADDDATDGNADDGGALDDLGQDQPHQETAAEDDTDTQENVEDNDGAVQNTERRVNPMRRYKIQEVIKRRQILLVQVVKEERGNKGAALTTYMSLAGRYCVLMPNASRSGGGVSRKITSAADRRRLRDLLKNLDVPEGMGVIMRTAGLNRNKSEIKRDFDYLMRLWEDVRSLTLESAAPALVYEEGDLIKRAIRDLYARDIEEVAVEGTEAYQAAKKLMRLMMPSHAKRVQPYRDVIPLFYRYQVEAQLESMHNPVVQLKSGGYIVIDTTEALVAIDVNSGRSTRERNIEETAVKTNLEAATEIGRQLRLRDLAGLIVIDFIDMEENRNQRAVEKRMKEAVKADRARIQLGRISSFGLFELSRQRLRPSIIETSTDTCPHCQGAGVVRSIESTALHVLRMIEEEGIRMRSSDVTVAVPTVVALYMLNQKRDTLIAIEERYGFNVTVSGDDSLIPPAMRLERIKAKTPARMAGAIREEVVDEDEYEDEETEFTAEETEGSAGEPARKRRPRRRRRKEPANGEAAAKSEDSTEAIAESEETDDADSQAISINASAGGAGVERPTRRRRRGRRGGRRRNQGQEVRNGEGGPSQAATNGDGNGHGSETELPNGPSDVPADTPPAPAPEPAMVEAHPPKSDSTTPSSEEQPRRGWWQRLIE